MAYLLPLLLLFCHEAFAQDITQLNTLSVSRHSTRFQSSNRSSSQIIDKEELQRSSASSVGEVLHQQLGLAITTTGSSRSQQGLFIRGNNTDDVLILIDGIPVNDPSTLGRQVDLGKLPLQQIEQIEVLKGPQSGIYGSDALGGVVLITTKSLSDSAREFGLSATSDETFSGSFSRSKVRSERFASLFSVSSSASKGFSAAKGEGFEKDGFTETSLLAKTQLSFASKARLNYQFLYGIVKEDIDDAASTDDDNRTNTSIKQYHALSFFSPIGAKGWSTESYLFFAKQRRDDTDPESGSTNHSFFGGDSLTFKTLFNRSSQTTLTTFGFEADSDSALTLSEGSFNTRNDPPDDNGIGVFVERERFFGKYSHSINLRYDYYEKAENFFSYRFQPQLELSENGFIFLTTSSGSKHPSLDQRFNATYGNSELQTQTAEYFDIGYKLTRSITSLQVIGFWQKDRDRIDYNTTTSRFENIEEVEQFGAESSFRLKVGHNSLTHQLNWVKVENKAVDRQLARRPEVSSSLNLSHRIRPTLAVNVQANYASRRFDSNSTNDILSSYSLFDLGVEKSFHNNKCADRDCSGLLRFSVKNIFDEPYELVKGYNTQGRLFSVEFSKKF